MGLATPIVQLLASLRGPFRFRGRILTLGVQFVQPSREEVGQAVANAALGPDEAAAPPLAPGRTPADDRFTLGALGFDQVARLDLYGSEGAEILADLTGTLPPELVDGFDAILDGGTLEHVFDLPSATRNLLSCLRVGGLMIHVSPFSGWENHGFFQMSPKMFARLWGGSGFGEIQAWCVDIPRAEHAIRESRVRPVADLDALVETDSRAARTLLVLVARRIERAALAHPIDSHLGEHAVRRDRCRPPDRATEAALRRLGLLAPSAAAPAPAAPRRRWFRAGRPGAP